jgi:hypothetical protein
MSIADFIDGGKISLQQDTLLTANIGAEGIKVLVAGATGVDAPFLGSRPAVALISGSLLLVIGSPIVGSFASDYV